ncbi:MAG: hypothetical protein ABI810_19300 [Sphingomonas bacterium]
MRPQTMRSLRQLHHYVGVFLAPAILFFAFSGAVQTFRLGEDKGWGGPPPAALVWMTSVHKDQTLPRAEPPEPAPPPPKADAAKPDSPEAARPAADNDHDHDGDHDHDHQAPRGPSPLPLKIFVVLLSLGLITSTLLGITIALNNRAMRRTSIVMLIAGTVLPLLLLLV